MPYGSRRCLRPIEAAFAGALLLAAAACDTADPTPPPSGGRVSAIVLDQTTAPALPPFSINQAVSVRVRLGNDYGGPVRLARACGGARADVQKEEGGAWRTVGTTGCGSEDTPLVVADGDSTEVAASFFVGALDVGALAGLYRLVLHVHAEGGGALPDSMRTTGAFVVVEAAPFPTPEVFAPGLVSTGAEEYRVTFTPDGRRAYFARGDAFFPASRQATIYETRREGGVWTAPVVASFSGTYPDIDPFVTPDGSRLYFSSIRPVGGAARTDADVWYVAWTGGGWGAPQHAGAVNSASDELYPSVASDGTLYVGSDRPGGLGGWDIYRAAPAGDGHGAAENVGAPVNTARWEFNPVVSPDGRTLVYTGLSYVGGAGFGDLYTSAREGGVWGTPEGIGSVNTALDEFHASRSPDGRLLFFVRRDPAAPGAHGDLHVVSWPPAPLTRSTNQRVAVRAHGRGRGAKILAPASDAASLLLARTTRTPPALGAPRMKIVASLALALALCADASAQPLAAAPPSVLVKRTPAAAARVVQGAAARSGLQAFDALGRRVAVVLDGTVRAGTTALVFDASALSAGAYLLRVVGETFTTAARGSVAR